MLYSYGIPLWLRTTLLLFARRHTTQIHKGKPDMPLQITETQMAKTSNHLFYNSITDRLRLQYNLHSRLPPLPHLPRTPLPPYLRTTMVSDYLLDLCRHLQRLRHFHRYRRQWWFVLRGMKRNVWKINPLFVVLVVELQP